MPRREATVEEENEALEVARQFIASLKVEPSIHFASELHELDLTVKDAKIFLRQIMARNDVASQAPITPIDRKVAAN